MHPAEPTLRPFTAADADFLAAMAVDPRITRFVGDGEPWTRERIDQRVAEALTGTAPGQVGAARWFVAEEAGRPVALAVATRRASGVEIGYWVAVGEWGRGVARTTAQLLLERVAALFDGWPVFARVHPDNAASVAVLLGIGLRRVGADAEGVDRYEASPATQASGSAAAPSP